MHSVTDRQTDGRQDDANRRSYCVAVRSAKNHFLIQNWMFNIGYSNVNYTTTNFRRHGPHYADGYRNRPTHATSDNRHCVRILVPPPCHTQWATGRRDENLQLQWGGTKSDEVLDRNSSRSYLKRWSLRFFEEVVPTKITWIRTRWIATWDQFLIISSHDLRSLNLTQYANDLSWR